MGTRADFYVGRGERAEWIGSIAWDGYPSGIPSKVLCAASEDSYRDFVQAELVPRKDWTAPSQGWPWPWDDSQTTDYAYAFADGKVWASCFGREWFDPLEEEPELADSPQVAIFPDMRAVKNVTWGARSGVMLISLPTEE